MDTKISIVTVAYNSEKTIHKAIESVLNQTYAPFEYIIVDGKSKDHTVDVAESYREKFEKRGIRYRIISEKDKGIYDAMNKGIAMAEGEVIGMINSDDWYETNALEVVAETYQNEKFDMMYADLNLVKENGSVIVKKAKMRKYITSRDWNHPTTFIRKAIYNVMQYDLSNLYADFDMMIAIRKKGYKVVIVNKVLANFATGGVSNEKKISSMISRIKDRYAVYRKNKYSRLYWFECVAIELAKFVLS